ncbi:glycosyltransferase family 4 protein [Ruminococcus sp. 5_1_39BFAA]|uniref:glycosyltransferase family 4 protein n=1 Tax=Ruminococcus sp. 5_1_39BFAA TaxID=457412 RepID=UPI0035630FAC
MRILIDLTSLADNFSGIERYAASLSLEMIQDTSTDFILIFKNKVHPWFEPMNHRRNVQMLVLPGCNKLVFNQMRLPNAIRKIQADYYLFLAFPVPVLLFKKNMVSTIHDICCWDCPETMNGMSKWYFRISHRIALLKCKSIITISEFSRQRIVDRLKYDKDKIWLIYCGVDEKFVNYVGSEEKDEMIREKYNLPTEYILTLSTLEPRKNLTLLLDVYARLIAEGKTLPPLVLAGRKGWKMDNLLESYSQDVKDRLIFTGFVEDEDLPDVYGHALLFVFPSIYEGFGMPPLEAMACGTQVLSSDGTSLPEVLGNAANYFSNDDRESLYFELKEICNVNSNNKSLAMMKDQVKKFAWKSEAEKILLKIKDKESHNENWN